MRNSKGNILMSERLKPSPPGKVLFQFCETNSAPNATLVNQVNDFEFFIVSSEQEALILELNLIKRYWPPYNVLLKDDKTFPYLRIKFTEDWPMLHITRRLENDDSHYFGPFASINSLRRSLDVLKKVFPLRSCDKPIDIKKNVKPCLKYDMGYCLDHAQEKPRGANMIKYCPNLSNLWKENMSPSPEN
jgi:excinuclease ABC subunit C